jgi:diguanylate cyclase (GGDEF)-like protein/PAS domain S-box-containing protein
MLAVAEGAIGYAVEYAIVGIQAKQIVAKIEYLGATTAPVFFFLFVLEYTHLDAQLKSWHLLMLWSIPVLTLLFAMTNELHHLVWTSFTPAAHNLLVYGHGVWFWVYGTWDYLLIGIGTILLVRAMARYPRYYRAQTFAVLVAILLPWLGNAIYVVGLSPLPGLDITPAAMSITGIILTYSMFKFELFELAPVARDKLIEDMRDGVIVLDMQNRIVDINPAARSQFGVNGIPIGEPVIKYLDAWPDLIAKYEHMNEAHTEICLDNNPPVYLDMHISPIANRRRRMAGKLVVMRDITALKAIEQAERLGRQRLTEILETVPDGIVIVDRSGQISYANPSAERLLGLTRSDLSGRSYNAPEWKITAPDGSPFPEENLPFVQVMRTCKPVYGVEHAIQRPDGMRLILSISAAPLRDVNGSIEGMVAALEDTTQRRQAHQMIAQKAEELSILNRINLTITAGLDFNLVLKTLHEQCQQVVSSDVFYVAMYEEQTGLIHIPLYYEGEYRPGPTLDIHSGIGLTEYIIASRRTLYQRDTLDENSPPPVHIVRTGGSPVRSYIGIPLFLRDKVIGVMSVQSYQPDAYSDDQIRLLESIAVQAAIVIENARLYGEVQRMAIIDELTDTYNYRGLLEFGAREVERARRFNRPLTALFFDIDDFRNFNNKYSHTTGNLILESTAACCQVVLRSVDIIARYGGDEFVILLPETNLETARKVARRLRKKIATTKIAIDDGKLSVTISAGLAELTDDTPNFLTLIDHANQAEHVAKLQGNCIFDYEGTIHSPYS